jgi:hypothetical protein
LLHWAARKQGRAESHTWMCLVGTASICSLCVLRELRGEVWATMGQKL